MPFALFFCDGVTTVLLLARCFSDDVIQSIQEESVFDLVIMPFHHYNFYYLQQYKKVETGTHYFSAAQKNNIIASYKVHYFKG